MNEKTTLSLLITLLCYHFGSTKSAVFGYDEDQSSSSKSVTLRHRFVEVSTSFFTDKITSFIVDILFRFRDEEGNILKTLFETMDEYNDPTYPLEKELKNRIIHQLYAKISSIEKEYDEKLIMDSALANRFADLLSEIEKYGEKI